MVMDHMAPMAHPITMPFKWLHWHHFVAMWRLKYPTKVDATMVTLAPMVILAPVAPLNGDVSSTFHRRYCTLKSTTPLESLVPLSSLTPMASMTPMNRHLHQCAMDRQCFQWRHWHHWHQWSKWRQWIINASMSAIHANGTNESPFALMDRRCFHWIHWCHCLSLAIVDDTSPRNGAVPKEPFRLHISHQRR